MKLIWRNLDMNTCAANVPTGIVFCAFGNEQQGSTFFIPGLYVAEQPTIEDTFYELGKISDKTNKQQKF